MRSKLQARWLSPAGTGGIRTVSSHFGEFVESFTNMGEMQIEDLFQKQSRQGRQEGRTLPGSSEPNRSHCEIGLKSYWTISHHTFVYLLFVFIIFHLQTEGLQNPPQCMWLDQTRLVNINELKGFDNSFNVFENLCIKRDLGKVKRSSIKNQDGNNKSERV